MRVAEYTELEKISLLMNELFDTQMKESYSPEGKHLFLEEISLEGLQKRFSESSVFYINEELNAVLELEKGSHIAYLFSKNVGQGNAKQLCEAVFKIAQEEVITVGAFSEAIGFYEKLGFIKVKEEQTVNEMTFTLMARLAK